MATPQLSPGILVREVDLTVGRADNVLQNNGGIAGPFSLGPVSEAIDITTEEEEASYRPPGGIHSCGGHFVVYHRPSPVRRPSQSEREEGGCSRART